MGQAAEAGGVFDPALSRAEGKKPKTADAGGMVHEVVKCLKDFKENFDREKERRKRAETKKGTRSPMQYRRGKQTRKKMII